ncbi:MAG TPA: TIGR03435 family protein, partial [Bryobacteraceae bacterium]|nr:TIGR03435 family protein [Bryobacteraceae bacterium]
MMLRVIAIALTAGLLFGQSGLEAVSIRPGDGSKPNGPIHGGPGSSDPGLVTMRNIDLFSLVAMAWGLHRYQLLAPDWMNSARFDISARVPRGIDVDQYRRMLQSMLAERYHLATHHESREMRIYDLTVAKNGPKMKPSANQSASADGLQPPQPHAVPPVAGYHGPVFLNIPALSMPRLAEYLSGFLDAPVNDATGLQGNYEIHLRTAFGGISSEPAADGASLSVLDVLPEQLGLRLTPGKAQVDV